MQNRKEQTFMHAIMQNTVVMGRYTDTDTDIAIFKNTDTDTDVGI